ncbi:sugar kinase [Dinghuibacter silviterrae]|uniref:2-dehydro-3-deoxygluconokinase n=1 Tax=Dinghuibacter silviterrae TaxID=1539049 RepID=A0A4R8DWP1_9BACT|nr:sugar kinase [Dinghuibacter silviterrae]TDX02358.1 2-dehydro-3-deoxygluconokinase [Dinghuibacter silviterrae]
MTAAFGELLLRLHSSDARRFLQSDAYNAYYAGAEANVGVLLSRLGVPVRYITRLPENDLARAGVEQLRAHGIDTGHILYGGDRLGVYFTEQGNGIRPTRVIYDRAGSSYAGLQPGMIDWASCFEGVSHFHWSGIAAAVSQGAADACREALVRADEKGIVISCDFNYRSMLWKYGKHPREVMGDLLPFSRIAVADLDSVNVYCGIDTDREAGFEDRFVQCVQALHSVFPSLQTLAMSFRRHQTYSGALWHKDGYFFAPGYDLPYVTDPIGAGDAFTGGLLYGIMNGLPGLNIIQFATACGALKQSIVGDWAILNLAEIEHFIQSGLSGRVIR